MENNSRHRILLAAIDEFGEMGYEHATTNNVMQRAGVSKGLIFHYFGSKEKLYISCVEYGLNLFREEMPTCEELVEKDYFERMFRFITYKFEFSRKNPQIRNLFADAYNRVRRGEIKDVSELFDKEKRRQYDLLVNGADTSMFRDDVSESFIIDYIEIVLTGVTISFLEKHVLAHNEIPDHFDELIDILKITEKLIKNGAYNTNPL